MKRKKLVVISHTEHYCRDESVVGWGPTVNEINYLSNFWEEVLHVACLYEGKAPVSSAPYINRNIKFVAISPTGGKKLWEKLNILWYLPQTLLKVYRSIRGATDVQFRSPTGIGVYLLPFFSFFVKRDFTFWVKYAGNWAQENSPAGYKFQKWWLKKNLAKCRVTINGSWADQPEHCLSFENPCLSPENILNGKLIQQRKKFDQPFRLVFVGRLEDEKGVFRIIEALKNLNPDLIERIDFIGDGQKRIEYEKQASFIGDKAVFHGFLDNKAVHEILSEAHFFLLPSNSEGFPKVIAEAACYGCLPIVSNVGSIGHYVKNGINGFIWDLNGQVSFGNVLTQALTESSVELNQKSENILQMAEQFTFENYRLKLETDVLSQ